MPRGGSARSKQAQLHRILGRCFMPCGAKDSVIVGYYRPQDHACIREPNHLGSCDFITPCSMETGKVGSMLQSFRAAQEAVLA